MIRSYPQLLRAIQRLVLPTQSELIQQDDTSLQLDEDSDDKEVSLFPSEQELLLVETIINFHTVTNQIVKEVVGKTSV